jgi:hypothetical protein
MIATAQARYARPDTYANDAAAAAVTIIMPITIGKTDSAADSLPGKPRERRFASTTTPPMKSSSDKTERTTGLNRRRDVFEFSGAESMAERTEKGYPRNG